MRAAALAIAALAAVLLVVGGLRAPAPAPAQPPRSVLVVGDSLVVGTTPYLRRELSGTTVTSDGRTGRPSTEAVGVLRSRLGGQPVVVFDAGTNDDPAQPGRLASDLSAARRITGDRCLVVATVHRPPYRGVSVDGMNRAVRSFAASASNVQLVDWRAAALANRRLINPAGVHPTAAGYAFRARLFARSIAACGSGSSGGGGGAPPSVGGLPPAGTQPPARDRAPGGSDRPRPPEPDRPQPRQKKRKPAPKPTLDAGTLIDEPVTIRSRGATLAGEMLAPAGRRRHPVVVMLPGAGAAVREQLREQAEYLAARGIGALIYDKRGSGDSTGDPDPRDAQMASDARAAIALLRGRPEVDPGAIGLWGLGEGGSVAPLVAAGNPQVAAVMVLSPSAIAPVSQREWVVRNALRSGGAGTGSGPVTRYYAVAGDRSADLRSDPARAWRRVEQPVLAVFAGDDDLVPVRESAAALRRALAAGGMNHDRTFRTFPGATHSLGVEAESFRPGSAPGLAGLSAAWLRAHLGGDPTAVVSTPLPSRQAHAVHVAEVERASLLERWPVQLAWLLLPALALLSFAIRRRQAQSARDWWWLGGVAALDVLALLALAYAVASIVDVDGRGVSAVAGVPIFVLAVWVLTLCAAVATFLNARRRGRAGAQVTAASAAWLALLVYWLI